MTMTEQRVTASNQFSVVIDALQLGRKTGVLSVERGDGGTLEEGIILFANGELVDATLGSHQGREAVARLFSWQACRFSFVGMPAQQIAALSEIARMPAEEADAGSADKDPSQEFRPADSERQNSLNSRPFLTADARESLDTIVSRF